MHPDDHYFELVRADNEIRFEGVREVFCLLERRDYVVERVPVESGIQSNFVARLNRISNRATPPNLLPPRCLQFTVSPLECALSVP